VLNRVVQQGRSTGSSDTAYAVDSPTEGSAVSLNHEQSPHDHVPGPDETTVPELEEDQTVAPRPEEEIADELRAKPAVEDHSQHPH
jgi:hypothetical protein